MFDPAVPTEDLVNLGLGSLAAHPPRPGAGQGPPTLRTLALTPTLPDVPRPEVLAEVRPLEPDRAGGLPDQPLLEGPHRPLYGWFMFPLVGSEQLPDIVVDVEPSHLLHELRQLVSVLQSLLSTLRLPGRLIYGHPAGVEVIANFLHQSAQIKVSTLGTFFHLIPKFE